MPCPREWDSPVSQRFSSSFPPTHTQRLTVPMGRRGYYPKCLLRWAVWYPGLQEFRQSAEYARRNDPELPAEPPVGLDRTARFADHVPRPQWPSVEPAKAKRYRSSLLRNESFARPCRDRCISSTTTSKNAMVLNVMRPMICHWSSAKNNSFGMIGFTDRFKNYHKNYRISKYWWTRCELIWFLGSLLSGFGEKCLKFQLVWIFYRYWAVS